MKRLASVVTTALVLMGCGSDISDTTTTASVDTTVPSDNDTNVAVTYSLIQIGNLDAAVDVVERSADDNFFYVVSRTGTIERWERNGTLIDEVLDVSSFTTGQGERGLLGLAFRQQENLWTGFVNMTNSAGNTVIASFPVRSDGTFDTARPTGTVVLEVEQPYANHNGGGIVVGPDNMLYVGMGDGGSANDPQRFALNTSSLLGKMLRIDPRSEGGYDIPSDNPYVGTTSGERGEIWSVGLRNPWRFSFDPQGNLWIADVGQGNIEEVSAASADEQYPGGRGVSFGWSAYEGSQRFNQDVTSPNAIMPVHEYTHDNGACSISGGAIGTNTSTPSRAGWYFYSDYCSGVVTAILTDGTRTVLQEIVAEELDSIVAVRSTSTSMYVVSLAGPVYELRVVRR